MMSYNETAKKERVRFLITLIEITIPKVGKELPKTDNVKIKWV